MTTPDDRASADAETLRQLTPPPRTIRDVKKRLRWGSERAMLALREYRAGAQPEPDEAVVHEMSRRAYERLDQITLQLLALAMDSGDADGYWRTLASYERRRGLHELVGSAVAAYAVERKAQAGPGWRKLASTAIHGHEIDAALELEALKLVLEAAEERDQDGPG